MSSSSSGPKSKGSSNQPFFLGWTRATVLVPLRALRGLIPRVVANGRDWMFDGLVVQLLVLLQRWCEVLAATRAAIADEFEKFQEFEQFQRNPRKILVSSWILVSVVGILR